MKRVMIVALLAFLSIVLINRSVSILEITTTPAGATVVIDDIPRGETNEPLSIGLTPGTHSVVITKDGYSEYRQDVKTVDGQTKTIEVTLKKL